MALTTDLSRSPYYDDYNVDKNFYRVLYRPGTAVQTRELNQMQTILQDQIDKFGRHIFVEGSVVEGCSFTFDNAYQYVKIGDTYANGFAFTITDFQNKYVYNNNGLQGVIINTVAGYIAQDPDLNTLYIKYLNVGTFANGMPQNTFANNDTLVISGNVNNSNTTAIIGNVTVATVTNSTGTGYAFTTSEGVIFQKGFFITVQPQTIIVSKYSNTPDNVSVGFNPVENIITPEADTSLLDNAAGAPNYAAPGAHRLQLIPTLFVTTTDQSSNSAFFSLVDFRAGVPISIKNSPDYNILGNQLAQRTYETNGNFIVNPFLLSTEPKASTDPLYHDYVNLISSTGLGYSEGYRVEFIGNNKTTLRKGVDTESISGQIVSANYGNYVYANQLVGDFGTDTITKIELHNVAKTAVSSGGFLSVGYSTSTKIGTAYVLNVAYDSGQIGTGNDVYRLYLFNVIMNAGQSFSNVKSIINYNSSVLAVADTVLQYNAASNTNIASLQETALNTLIFPLGQQALNPSGFNNTQYVYRNKSSASFACTGIMSVSLASIVGTGTESYTYSGVLTHEELRNFELIPTTTVTTTNKTGTVSASSGQNTVTGSATTFINDYQAGDFIKINNETHLVVFVANNTLIRVSNNFSTSPVANTHAKQFVAGVPIDFTQVQRSASISGSTAQFSLNETLASSLQTTIYHDILRKSTISAQKKIVKNAFVKIDCSSHPANTVGPWSLGLPDVYQVNNIYIGSSGVYSNSVTDSSEAFTFVNGQTDNLYTLASIKLQNASIGLLSNTSTILVDLDVFVPDFSQGVGFFTANSYPIDDINTSNTTAITIQEIPEYLSSSSLRYDLRDCVDFRVYVSNTATVNTIISNATINPSNTNSISILSSGSYVPTPDSNWQSDVIHYLPRNDLAIVTNQGAFKIIEGISDSIPQTPLNPVGTMQLGVVNIPPYPSLTSAQAKNYKRFDYAITASITQNKRYTMAEIGKLATRITNLEYYTSLNLLEQATNSLLVKNDTTGLNRFKNGILVDPFAGFDISNTLDPNFNISIDSNKREMRPAFYQRAEQFRLDTSLSTGVVQTGALIMLDYNWTPYITQQYANKFRNCIEGNIYVFKCNVNLQPNYQTTPDMTKNPDVVNNLDLSQNWINLQNAWGTQWGNWQTVATNQTNTVGNVTQSGSQTDSQGNIINTYNTQTTTTNYTLQSQTGTQLINNGNNDQQFNLGTFVQDVSINPYISSTKIMFSALGLKPGAKIYAYFNNTPVSNWCVQTTPVYGPIIAGSAATGLVAYQPSGSNWIGSAIALPNGNTLYPQTGTPAVFGDPMYVQPDGTIYGWFQIPPNTFQATELTFMLCDVDNLTTGIDAITTQGTGIFYATNLSIAKGTSILNTRVPIISSQEVTQQQTLTSSSTSDQTSLQVIPGPPITQQININNNTFTTVNQTNVNNVTNVTQNINNNTVVNDVVDNNGNIIATVTAVDANSDSGSGGGGGGAGGAGCSSSATASCDAGDS